MSDKELFEKYAEICDHRQRRLMDVQETALFCALRDMLKRGAKQAELVNGPTQSTISHDDWYALCNERDALRAEVERLRKDAERYRWLRDSQPEIVDATLMDREPHQWDSAIDAAIADQQETPTVDCAHCHKTFAGPMFCCERSDCPHANNRRIVREEIERAKGEATK